MKIYSHLCHEVNSPSYFLMTGQHHLSTAQLVTVSVPRAGDGSSGDTYRVWVECHRAGEATVTLTVGNRVSNTLPRPRQVRHTNFLLVYFLLPWIAFITYYNLVFLNNMSRQSHIFRDSHALIYFYVQSSCCSASLV